MVGGPPGLGGLDCLGEQLPGGDGGEGAGQMELLGPVGVGAGPLGNHQVIEIDVVLKGSGGAHPDDVVHIVAGEQLVGVDADGGHAHAGGHDGDLHPLVGAGIALDAPDVVHQHRVLQEVLRNELRAQGVAGHKHGLAEVSGFGGNMGSGCNEHSRFLLNGKN